jgi:hypothetical protein
MRIGARSAVTRDAHQCRCTNCTERPHQTQKGAKVRWSFRANSAQLVTHEYALALRVTHNPSPSKIAKSMCCEEHYGRAQEWPRVGRSSFNPLVDGSIPSRPI